MSRPNSIIDYEEMDLKLGIKSSLPHVKSTVALAILMWECAGHPAKLVYSAQSNTEIVIISEVEQALVAYLSELCYDEQFDNVELIGVINQNQLFKSQMEALVVAFELVWKIAKVSFVDRSKNASAERTGRIRYPKQLEYSVNMDVIHSAICMNEKEYAKVLAAWLGTGVSFAQEFEKALLHLLTALSESAIFKLAAEEQDIVFCQNGIYQKLLETAGTVNIDDIKEAKGPLRILKSLLSDGMNPYLQGTGRNVTANPDEDLQNYQSRVDTFLRLSSTKVINNNPEEIEMTLEAEEQKELFRAWMGSQVKANGKSYSANTIAAYISQMQRGYSEFEPYKEYTSAFQIQKQKELEEYTDYLFNADGFDEFNDRNGSKACSCGFVKYGEFLLEQNTFSPELCFNTLLKTKWQQNRIIFGAPGTGKSYMINQQRKELLGDGNELDYERVTFHPDYTYANFVGTYKPIPVINSVGEETITYKYVPGPFMRVYINALKNGRTEEVKPFLLIIEEINRADVAAVFGDIFQLLDRDDNGVSEYPIQASEDIKKYLAEELGGRPDDYTKIRIPNNMFIWATMNSADQGVFPMDTAFKRRWDFTYIGIDENDKELRGKTVVIGTEHVQRVEWNKLRKAINKFLAKQKINEDKQLGPYFISRKIVVPQNGNEIDHDKFIETFKSKVIMYLFEDAAKQKRASLFEGCFQNSSRYSEICREFEEKGLGIFNHEISLNSDPEDIRIGNNTEEMAE